MRRALTWLLATLLVGCASADGLDSILRVGPTREIKTLRDALRIVRDGGTIEIDAATYAGDVGSIRARNITIRGVNGRPRFDAAGAAEEGKGILVVKSDDIVIENIELANARVIDRNGAGIRHEAGRLVVRNVRFIDNENGILTGNNAALSLEVHDSEFIGNGHGDGFSHQLYAGTIGRLLVQGTYFSRAKVGHLLKSRARTNLIRYNRLTDEEGGTASYEIDLPNGGLAIVVGNLIEQSAKTENSTMIAFGAEGIGRWPLNELHLSHNTIVNHRPEGCLFAHTRSPSHAQVVNNLFIGAGCQSTFAGTVDARNNFARPDERWFVDPARFDYRLRGDSDFGAPIDAGVAHGLSLVPTAEYVHPAGTRALAAGALLRPGAFHAGP